MLLCGLTKWQRNNCKGIREIQWAQVTVSKQYREHAFRKPPSTSMDGGWIKGSFDPWQRSLFVPPVSSVNTKERGPLLAGKCKAATQTQSEWGLLLGQTSIITCMCVTWANILLFLFLLVLILISFMSILAWHKSDITLNISKRHQADFFLCLLHSWQDKPIDTALYSNCNNYDKNSLNIEWDVSFEKMSD